MSNIKNLPVKKDSDFIGAFETMQLDELKDKLFTVAVSTGDPEKSKFITTTVHGPYSFIEMVEEVGYMWQEHTHHSKVIILDKNRDNNIKWLDKNTIDYIEANWRSLIMDSVLDGSIENKEYTCRAGINEEEDSSDPRKAKTGDEDADK